MEFSNIEVLQLPNISKLTFQKIHKDYLKVLFSTTILIFVIIFSAAFILFNNIQDLKDFEYLNYIYGALIFSFIFILAWLFIGFSRRKYVLRDKDVTYKNGVLIKTITTVPFSRVQHVEIDEGPISRFFKLASLSVFTAGDSSDDLVIKGVKKEEALRIKEFITQQING